MTSQISPNHVCVCLPHNLFKCQYIYPSVNSLLCLWDRSSECNRYYQKQAASRFMPRFESDSTNLWEVSIREAPLPGKARNIAQAALALRICGTNLSTPFSFWLHFEVDHIQDYVCCAPRKLSNQLLYTPSYQLRLQIFENFWVIKPFKAGMINCARMWRFRKSPTQIANFEKYCEILWKCNHKCECNRTTSIKTALSMTKHNVRRFSVS